MTLSGLIEEKVAIPEKVTVTVEGSKVTVKGPKGTLVRDFYNPKTKVSKDGDHVVVSCELPRVKDKAMVGTFAAHINNMIEGVTVGFEYEMKIVYSHFPMKTAVKGDKFLIENFLGERAPRVAKIMGDTKIQVKGNEVSLTGIDIEAVSQTAANIERATHIWGYDPRVFQDGIYITTKAKKVSQ
ncbi:50S ribosomal protein L6 [Methanomassiliicoccus luminyensis]|jgi:large subunit ribosomal protein L6|uniref:50S ribosomal protein L6 n=1 Tax=Methanomassiliicoccus luminyensis TaxID=1080712 RepID=UPI000372DEA1|nr:50S ribosomal protein L6 [Methanomassiliicoccus luminyensis]